MKKIGQNRAVLFSIVLACAALVRCGAEPCWISSGHEVAATNPVPCYVSQFEIGNQWKRAEARIACCGWFELRVNGTKVGENVLEPVTCQPNKRVSEVVHDLAGCLRGGTNSVEVLVGGGWYGCSVPEDTWGFHAASWHRRFPPSVRVQIVVDGAVVLESDGSWRIYDSALRFSAFRCGERYDARFKDERENIRPVTVLKSVPPMRVSCEDAVPCRTGESFEPQFVTNLADGVVLYDFGHNIAGWCELEAEGPVGSEIHLDYDESLSSSGDLLGHVNRFLKGFFKGQHDEYVLCGEGLEKWHPRFSYDGFRYVRIQCLGGAKVCAVRARVVTSAYREAGGARTSDLCMTRLLAAARRSYMANFVGIPTDCPHREKNGWTGDAQLICETGLWNFDIKEGYVHFLRMMLDSQLASGKVPCILPHSESFGFERYTGPAWDALLFEVPRRVFEFYGDDAPVREAYAAMKRYIRYLEGLEGEDGLVEVGLGDWCHSDRKRMVKTRLTDSAYYYHFHRELADWAMRFGEESLAGEMSARAVRIARSFNAKYYRGNGVYANGEWTALASVLYFKGLCHAGVERLVAGELVRRIRVNGHRCDYGILGSKWIPRVLAEYGYADDAWKLFVHPESPGYMGWLDNGYDTLGESMVASRWAGSHNHVMFADYSAWFFRYVAGIVPAEPGFSAVAFRPCLISGVDFVEAKHQTPHGVIRSSWRRGVGGTVQYEFSVPEGIVVRESPKAAAVVKSVGL